MTPQERQLIDDLFDRLAKLESAPRDPDADAAIAQGLRSAPNAVYALVQTVLVQDEALKRAHDRIQELEGGGAPPSRTSPAASSIRCATRCSGRTSQPRGSVPNVRRRPTSRPPGLEQRPGDAAVASAGHTIRARLRPGPLRSALWRAAAAGRRRRRLVPRNRGGGRGRRGRRLAAARQHPLDDGRQPSAGLRRHRRPRRQRRRPAGRGAISPAAIWRATPGSTTSVRSAVGRRRRNDNSITRRRLFDQRLER